MASFRVHEDQENSAFGLRKDNADVFSAATQRRALGDLGQFACNQSRSVKLVSRCLSRPLIHVLVLISTVFQPGLTNVPCKGQDENRTVRQISNNEKNILPPVAQFRAFSVYEDKPSEAEVKKREPTFKPFVAKELKKDSFFVNSAENVRALCAQVQADKQLKSKDLTPLR